MDEIRLAVSSGFHTNPRSGADIEGVFFGSHTENVLRIAAWRPISRDELKHVLGNAARDPALRDLEPVGWFVPHRRGGLAPAESDLAVFEELFPQPWQFTLVLEPALVGATRAAFFLRNADGKVGEHNPQQDFKLEPLHAPRVHGRGRAPEEAARGPLMSAAQPSSRAVRANREPAGEGPIEGARTFRSRRPPGLEFRQRKSWMTWGWIIPLTALIIYGGVIAHQRLMNEPKAPTLSLALQDFPGAQLHVNWSKDALPVQMARRGELVFEDAGKKSTVQLDAAHLRQGSAAYARHSGNVKVKLSLYTQDTDAPAIEEVAEFNGPAPEDVIPVEERKAWEKQKSDLQAEIKRLRAELTTERTHRQDLQRLIRIMDQRLKAAKK